MCLHAAGPVVWTASSLARIWQNSTAGSSTAIDIYAAKDEVYSFQIGVQSPSGNLTNVTVANTALTGPAGSINEPDISLFREQYIYVPALPLWLQSGPNAPNGAGMYPDGLLPFIDPETGQPPKGGTIVAQPFTVAAGVNQVIWVDVHVPPTSKAGLYKGTFTVSSDQGTGSITLNLHVWGFALPTTSSYRSSVQAYNAANRNDLMARELLRNRQSPSWWLSSTPSLESSYIATYGMNTTAVFSSTGWYLGNCTVGSPPYPEPTAAQYANFYAAHDHRLWMWNLIADQVDPEHNCTGTYPTIKKWCDDMHAAVPQLHCFLSISPQSAAAILYGSVDTWAIMPMDYQNHSTDIQSRQAAGDLIWFYNAQAPDNYSPKQNLNWNSLDWRLSLGYLSANLNLSGWQQWAVDCWGPIPWTDGTPGGCSSPDVPGDGFSMYPGGPAGLVGYAPSIRIKWSRDGINDSEYVYMLNTLGQGAWVKSLIDPIAHDFANWTRDYTQVESVRILLGNKIEQLSGGPPPQTPVITSNTTAQGKVGMAFSYQITATNSPTAYSAAGLPPGLSLNAVTGVISGVISGTPTVIGKTTVTISASNSGGTGSATLTISVKHR
jgi:hypothetical protein